MIKIIIKFSCRIKKCNKVTFSVMHKTFNTVTIIVNGIKIVMLTALQVTRYFSTLLNIIIC